MEKEKLQGQSRLSSDILETMMMLRNRRRRGRRPASPTASTTHTLRLHTGKKTRHHKETMNALRDRYNQRMYLDYWMSAAAKTCNAQDKMINILQPNYMYVMLTKLIEPITSLMHEICTWCIYMYIKAYLNLCRQYKLYLRQYVPLWIQIDHMPRHACIRRWQHIACLFMVMRVNIVDNLIRRCKTRYCTCCHNSMKQTEPMNAIKKKRMDAQPLQTNMCAA
jgi:hypothetical protein